MATTMLTTIDNPYNPFTQFDEWQAFDESQGYNTCEYLARVADLPALSPLPSLPSGYLSNEERDAEMDAVIEEILKLNILGIYKKVSRE